MNLPYLQADEGDILYFASLRPLESPHPRFLREIIDPGDTPFRWQGVGGYNAERDGMDSVPDVDLCL